MEIPLSRPDITESEIQAVCEVLRTPNLSLGPKLPEFEQNFARYIGCKYAIAVNSGTSGLFMCMLAAGIGPGDEVITPPFTFIATSNSILMAGATPVFADIDPNNLNIDPKQIEKKITNKTKAILPVEVFGNPANFDKICDVARKHNLIVIEDSCEALGSSLNGKNAGTFGLLSTFAFYPNKQMTTGEGGMILTDNEELADSCASLRNQGRSKMAEWLSHDRLGYNFRLSDINCALGIVQLSRMDEMKAKRQQAAKWYKQLLADESRIIIPQEEPGCDVNWFVYVIRLAENYTLEHRDKILVEMRNRGIQCKNYFPPVLSQPFMAKRFNFKKGDFPVTDSVCDRVISLPFYNNLSYEEISVVCRELKSVLDKI
ncbi:MAG: DegT/DnrJ/EryC1/StrS family aminotransferase [Phycisphaerae bacterium]